MRTTFVSKSCGILVVVVVRRIIVVESIDRSIVVVVGRGCGTEGDAWGRTCLLARPPSLLWYYPVRVVRESREREGFDYWIHKDSSSLLDSGLPTTY